MSDSDNDTGEPQTTRSTKRMVAPAVQVLTKKRLKGMIERSQSEACHAVKFDSDSDLDEEPIVAKKPVKVQRPSIPALQKPTHRIQACGERSLDRCVTAARDNGHGVRVVVVALSLRINGDAGADRMWRADCRDGVAYDLYPPHERDQTELGESEFLGFFFSNVCSPGVADHIADMILEDENTHIVVVDPSKGTNFTRLLACIAAIKIGFKNAALGATLYKQALKPIDARWKAVLAKARGCQNDTQLRGQMRDHYYKL